MALKTGPVKLQLRLPKETHEKIQESSDSSGRSINAEILFLLEKGLLAETESREFLTESDKDLLKDLIKTMRKIER